MQDRTWQGKITIARLEAWGKILTARLHKNRGTTRHERNRVNTDCETELGRDKMMTARRDRLVVSY